MEPQQTNPYKLAMTYGLYLGGITIFISIIVVINYKTSFFYDIISTPNLGIYVRRRLFNILVTLDFYFKFR